MKTTIEVLNNAACTCSNPECSGACCGCGDTCPGTQCDCGCDCCR